MNDVLPDGWKAGYAVTLTNGVVLSRALTRDTYRRGLIVTITYSVDGVGVTPLIYEYDYLGRVTNRNGDAFGYNARSEVTAANIASNEYGYAYDDTGNHLVNTVNTFTNLRVASSRGIHGAMRKRIPTRADCLLCMGAPRRSPVFSTCQAFAS